jgi:hypothetical protein
VSNTFSPGDLVLVLLNGRQGRVMGPADDLYQARADEPVYAVVMVDDSSVVQAGESSLQPESE